MKVLCILPFLLTWIQAQDDGTDANIDYSQLDVGRVKGTTTCTLDMMSCNFAKYEWRELKLSCGVECGLYGKADPDCRDHATSCPEWPEKDWCEGDDPMNVEYNCPKSCGFCEHPN